MEKEKLLCVLIKNLNEIDKKRRKKNMYTRLIILMYNRIKRKRMWFLIKGIKQKYRRFWTCVEASTFWEVEVPKLDKESYKNKFRVNRATFDYLVRSLQNLRKKDTYWRYAIPLEKRVAIALYALGSSSEYRTIASLFGVGRTTVGEIVVNVCREICRCFFNVVFDAYPPTDTKIKEIVSGFESLGFPQCYGAIDGSHIEVQPTKSEATDYFNFKGWYSVVLFASVDHRYRFTYINIGAPGKSNDSTIFEASKLKFIHENNATFKRHTKEIEGVAVPVLLIGDSAFKLSKYVMKPFPFKALQDENEKLFNKRLSSCRRVVENAFGQMKARFRRVGRGMEVNMKNTNIIIKAACILHNICNNNNDHINNNWMNECDTENRRQQLNRSTNQTINSGHEIRNAIMNYFVSNGAGERAIGVDADDGGMDVNLNAGDGVDVVAGDGATAPDDDGMPINADATAGDGDGGTEDD